MSDGPSSPATRTAPDGTRVTARRNPEGYVYEEIEPPNRLAEKVTRDGPSLDEIEARAEAEIAALATAFAESYRADLARLQALARTLERDGADAAARAGIARITHDIKGQAATFGYPLAGEIARTLNAFLRMPEPAAREARLVRTCVDALAVVQRDDIRTADDPRGRELADGLEAAVRRLNGA